MVRDFKSGYRRRRWGNSPITSHCANRIFESLAAEENHRRVCHVTIAISKGKAPHAFEPPIMGLV